MACSILSPINALAQGGGIYIQGTRIVYPLEARQQSVLVGNASTRDSYLVQSWVENAADGQKSQDFFVTPPLYVSAPNGENTLRLMRVGDTLPKDRESLYYFVAKAIPALAEKAKDAPTSNELRITLANRIKLFVRPKGLQPSPGEAPGKLTFTRSGSQVEVNNPTPYYLTLTNIKVGKTEVEGFMVAPKSSERKPMPQGNDLTFSTINDYGAVSPPVTVSIK